ncbi:MAG: SDR family NAD(P)-dependent oxidoreductase, partial [Deltaproteobacteria bacterium]|nr:SDR family NAD(P)-dependent oxidoreductase [Deltaproteobacteria bacterium]
ALAATFDPKPLVAPDIRPEDLNTIIYTGGTTGRPKGVRQPYRSAAYMTMVQMAEWEWPEEMRFLIATPLSHAAAAFVVPTLQRGGAFVALQGFTPDLFFDAIEQHKITSTFLVPVMIYPLLDHPRAATADLSSLETLFYGASPMSPARLEEGVEKWGQIFFQCFGQSEAPMALTHLKKADHDLSKPGRFASCGRPSPWVHLSLLDENNEPVAEGEAGEICVRAPLVMEGYNGLPEQTAEAFAGGWLHTGDVGRFDDEGFLHIVDRKKDMIVTGGFNVFPSEIEDVISAHPAVAQVAVVGVPEEKWGEAVKAVVILRPGHEGTEELAAELKAAVKEAKGAVQSPKSVDFVTSIPLSPLGKPDDYRNPMTKRTALVTGAGGGLGHATVERLLANGWKVFAADISKDLLRSSLHDPDVVPVVMDVTDRESIRSAYDAVASQTDRLDGIVNFAGIMGLGSLTDIPEERLARILDVNVMGTYRVNKKFFPLVEAARGRIVNISSETVGRTP